jgi:hypothetical protein
LGGADAHLVDAVALHQDPLGALGQRAASECALQVVVLGEAAQHDFDRALPVIDVVVVDVREHPSLGSLADELGIVGVKQRDHRARGATHDLLDQFEGVVGTLPEADQGDVGSLAHGDGRDVIDLDLSGDHLVPQADHDGRDDRQTLLALVGDEDAQVLRVAVYERRLHVRATV